MFENFNIDGAIAKDDDASRNRQKFKGESLKDYEFSEMNETSANSHWMLVAMQAACVCEWIAFRRTITLIITTTLIRTFNRFIIHRFSLADVVFLAAKG